MTYKKYGKGWFRESERHRLAAKGVKTKDEFTGTECLFGTIPALTGYVTGASLGTPLGYPGIVFGGTAGIFAGAFVGKAAYDFIKRVGKKRALKKLRKKKKIRYSKDVKTETLVVTSDGTIQSVNRLLEKGTEKQKEEYESGHGIVFDAYIKGNRYHSVRYPEINKGIFLQ